MLRNSLRFRILLAFCIFCLITGTTYTGYVIMTLMGSEDAIFNHRVSLEINDYLARHALDPKTPLPSSAYIKGYIGTSGLSEKQLRLVAQRTDGVFEYEDLDLHIGIAALPGRTEKLFIFYNTENLEIHGSKLKTILPLMAVSILFFLILAIVFSLVVSGKVIQPVIRLADIIRASDPARARCGFSDAFYHDEIGFLAQTLEHYQARAGQAIEEEKRFASDVSHELRTPVTAIKGALDVIKRTSEGESDNILRPVARIDRSVRDMENLIETFLTLSRAQGQPLETESFVLLPVMHDIIDQNRYLLRNKEVEVTVNADPDLAITAPPLYFRIVASNLVRNAFQYTRSGTITIDLGKEQISVTDTGIGFSSSVPADHNRSRDPALTSKGFGIGLSIVRRLCERAQWQLEISGHEGRGTRACLKFRL